MRSVVASVVLAVASIGAAGCGMSSEDYSKLAQEVGLCTAADSCVVAGGADCVCPVPVVSNKRDEIDQAARDVNCGGFLTIGANEVNCAYSTDAVCVDGRCRFKTD